MEIAGFALRSPRRPVHRPAFDVLEARILPTVQVIPLAPGSPYPVSLLPGSDGGAWLLMKYGSEVDHIAADGTGTRIPLIDPYDSMGFQGYSNGVTVGPDGNLWVSGNLDVERVTPEGEVTSFAIGGSNGFPFGDDSWSIVTGPDGALWFDGMDGSIGRITTNGVISLYAIPNEPYDATSITNGPDGALWFADGSDIGRITTDGTITMFPAQGSDDLTTGPDGNLWFTTYREDQIGRMTTDGQLEYFSVPTKATFLTSLQVGPDGALWFAEDGTGRIGRITTDGQITDYPLPDAPPPGSSPYGAPVEIAFGPDGSLWYTTSFDEPSGNTNATMGWFYNNTPHEVVHLAASDLASFDAEGTTIPPTTSPDFAGVLADFKPIQAGDTAADYASTMDWGDGTTSAGLVVPTDQGTFQVVGSHSFEDSGFYEVSVSLTSARASLLPIVTPAVVQDFVEIDPVTYGPIAVDPLIYESGTSTIPGPGGTSDHYSGTPSQPNSSTLLGSATPAAPPTESLPILSTAIEPTQRSASLRGNESGATPGPSVVLPLTLFEATASNPASSSGLPASITSLLASSPSTAPSSIRAGKPVPTAVPAANKLGSPRKASKPAPKPPRVSKVDLPARENDPQVVPVAGLPTPAR